MRRSCHECRRAEEVRTRMVRGGGEKLSVTAGIPYFEYTSMGTLINRTGIRNGSEHYSTYGVTLALEGGGSKL